MFKKTSSYFIVLLSLSIIFLSFKYDFKNLFPNQLNKKLYLKSQHTNKDIKVSIKNGCGIKGLGLTYKKYLLNNSTSLNSKLQLGCDRVATVLISASINRPVQGSD